MFKLLKKYPPVRLAGIRSVIGKTTIILPCVFMTAVGIGMSALGLLFYVNKGCIPRYSLITATASMTLALFGVITSPYLPLAFQTRLVTI